jgi:hypothetical protein
MIPYAEDYRPLRHEVIEPAVTECGLECVLADHKFTGPVLERIEGEIARSEVCIAEISDNNANVMYELGLARAMKKEVILLTKHPDDAPFDLRNMQMIPYAAGARGLKAIAVKLREAIIKTIPLGLVGRMLVPSGVRRSKSPFVIAASPLSWRMGLKREGGFKSLISTSSDSYGIRSLIHEFGYIYGTERLPELIDPEDYVDAVVKNVMHLYCIGSPKSNRWTGAVLRELNRQWSPTFTFVPTGEDLRDVRVKLKKDGEDYAPIKSSWEQDFGLIIRGPNPYADDHMVTVLAGCRSTGTEAACRGATDHRLLTLIQNCGCNLDDFEQPFYAIIGMERFGKEKDYRVNEETMGVLEAGALERPA